MAQTIAANTARQRLHLPLLLGLVVAGVAGNYFSFPIFPGIDFLFGSVFAMLVLQFCGWWRGVLAAVLISSVTYLLWNHPYAIIVLSAEVAVVGLLMQRRNMGMLMADAIYWLLLGMPLVYLFCYLANDALPCNADITMTKQAVNGVANALLARILFAGVSHGLRNHPFSLHELLGNLLTAFLLFPALAMLAANSRTDLAEIDRNIRSTLQDSSQNLVDNTNHWLQDRTRTLMHLSELASSLSAQQMQHLLTQAQVTDGNLLRIELHQSQRDGPSVMTAYAPPNDASDPPNTGELMAGRADVASLQSTLKPVLTDILPARSDKTEPIALLLAPVVQQGQYGGYVNGLLQFQQLHKMLASHTDRSTLLYTLLNRHGDVILSNHSGQQALRAPLRRQGVVTPVDAHISQWHPLPAPNTTAAEQWKQTYYMTQSRLDDVSGWQLLLEQPVAPFQALLYDNYANKLGWLLVVLLGTLATAELLSRRTTASLDRLSAVTRELASNVAVNAADVRWPQSNIIQVSQLVDNFKSMSASLTRQFNAIHQLNETLEQRIDARTADLAASEKRFHSLFEANSSVMMLVDPQSGQIEDVNQAAADFYGYSRTELTHLLITSINTLPLAAINAAWDQARAQGRGNVLFAHRLASGDLRDVEVHSSPIDMGERVMLFNIVHDVTERRRSQLALDQSEAKYRALVENSHDIIYTLNAQGVLTFVSAGWTELLGHPVELVQGKSIASFVHPDDLPACLTALQAVFNTGARQTDVEVRVRHQNGSWRWHSTNGVALTDAHGRVIGFEGNSKDITEHRELEERVRQLAFFDPLTRLPNRRMLSDRLNMAMAASQRSGMYGALMFLDLDNFKPLNDAHGHGAGDLLLIEVAGRLLRCVRAMDTVARFGGDEFVVMLSELALDLADSRQEAALVAEKIRLAVAEPYLLTVQQPDGSDTAVTHHCSVSMGVTLFLDHQFNHEDILKQADAAMYAAKDGGRNTIRFHDRGKP